MNRLIKFGILFLAIGFIGGGCEKEPLAENSDVDNVDKTFTYDPNSLNWELAEKCALYSALAYQETRFMKNNVKPTSKANFEEFLDNYSYTPINNTSVMNGYAFYYSPKKEKDNLVEDKNTPVVLHAHLKWEGFKEIDSKNYGNSIVHDISYTLAYKEVNNDELLLVVILRGTDGVEWFGNMDIWEVGTSPSDRHFSFEQANKGLWDKINKYIADNDLKNYPINLLITGHSRGAAVANLLAVDANTKNWCNGNVKNVYAYTFATPNNTKNFVEYSNIFNFCFNDDFVPQVPLDTRFLGWKYGKSGKNYHACAEDLYNKNVNGFQSLVDKYINLSEKRNASLTATQKVANLLHVFDSIAPTVNRYYNTVPLLDMLPDNPRRISLHMYMRNYVAQAAVDAAIGTNNPFGVGTAGAALLAQKINKNSDVHTIADFLVDGAASAHYVNDTHQALTYYYALISGKNNFSEVDRNDDDLTEDIHNIIPDDILEKIIELGVEINGGNRPPNIEGVYIASALELVKNSSSMNIAEMWDMYITFSGQNNTALTVNADYTVQSEGPWWSTVTMSSKGPGSFIVGEGNKFTVFVDGTREQSGYIAKTVEIFSGEISATGIINYQWAVVMIDDRGDPLDAWIENGEGYLKKDSDGFSERVNENNVPSRNAKERNTNINSKNSNSLNM